LYKLKRGTRWLEICNLPVATADGNSHLLLLTRRSFKNVDIRRRSAASLADRPRKPIKPVVVALAVVALTVEAAVVIAHAPQRERQ
jgi:hypothetical protein